MSKICMLPWISLEVTPMGTVKPCCMAIDEIPDKDGSLFSVKETSLMDVYHSNYMKDMRQEFRDGILPETCNRCWAEEDAGRTSKRMNTFVKFSSLFKDIDYNTDTPEKLWFLDLKLGNICNLKCRICGSWSSSKWASEELDYVSKENRKKHTAYQMLKNGAWPRESNFFWNSLHNVLSDVQFFEFTGGEPFLIEEHYNLLEFAIEKGYAENISLHYNTNGTVYSERLIELWKHFKLVEVAFSIDNVGKRFEYERFGANWEEVNQNIFKYRQVENLQLQLCFTVNLLNVLYIYELLQWAKDINFDFIHWNMLHGPDELSIALLPYDVGEEIISYLNTIVFTASQQKEINNVIAMIRNGKRNVPLEKIIKKLSVTDKYRNQHLSDTHPELARILNYEKT